MTGMESTCLPLIWPGLENMWVEFVVVLSVAPSGFLYVIVQFSPFLQNQHLKIPI